MTNKEAIDIIKNRLNTYYCTEEDLQALDLAIKALNTQESLEKKIEFLMNERHGEWILVSERLPDWLEVVLVTDEKGKVYEYERRTTDGSGNVCEEWSFLGRKIIAWQPLPEAYKEGGAK